MVGVGEPIASGGPLAGVPVVLTAGEQTWRATPDRTWTIGRAAESDVQLEDLRVSRQHATLESTPQGWVLVNHGTNGMFVDGQRVERLAVLQPVTVSMGAPTGGVLVQMQPEPPLEPVAAVPQVAPEAAVTQLAPVAQNQPLQQPEPQPASAQPAQPPAASAQPAQLPPANWYPDPAGSGRLRYFNGTNWTDDYTTPAAAQPPAGWYPDPSGAPGQRYWDGTRWTP